MYGGFVSLLLLLLAKISAMLIIYLVMGFLPRINQSLSSARTSFYSFPAFPFNTFLKYVGRCFVVLFFFQLS